MKQFDINLDEFPGLFEAPIETYPEPLTPEFLAEIQKIYLAQINSKERRSDRGGDSLELCRRFLQNDEQKAAYFAERSHWWDWGGDPFAYNKELVEIFGHKKPDQTPEETIRNLLGAAQRYSKWFILRSVFLVEAGRLCADSGLIEEARLLYLAVMGAQYYGKVSTDGFWFLKSARERYFSFDTGPDDPFWSVSTESTNAFNPLSRGQEEFLKFLLKRFRSSDQFEKIVATAQNIVGFRPVPPPMDRLGTTRFGGLPDVPSGWTWPGKELEFLAQINLAEVAPVNRNGVLPTRGLLSFFARNLCYGWDDESCLVMFFDGDISELQRAEAPEGYNFHGQPEQYSTDLMIFNEMWAKPYPAIDLIFCEEISVNPPMEIVFESGKVGYEVSFDDLISLDNRVWWEHQMLGGNDEMAYQQRKNEREGTDDAQEWTLLLAVDSNDDIGMMFNDAGTFYFMIRKDDLAARRFDRVSLDLVSG